MYRNCASQPNVVQLVFMRIDLLDYTQICMLYVVWYNILRRLSPNSTLKCNTHGLRIILEKLLWKFSSQDIF